MLCKDCRYFTLICNDTQRGSFGECIHEKFNYFHIIERDFPYKDGLGYYDYEGFCAGFYVGPEFGCIHFTLNVRKEHYHDGSKLQD